MSCVGYKPTLCKCMYTGLSNKLKLILGHFLVNFETIKYKIRDEFCSGLITVQFSNSNRIPLGCFQPEIGNKMY